MIYLIRRERFSSAHRLYNPELSDQENEKIYGPCANPNWHGHNYVMWITIAGEVNPQTGYVADLKEVSQIIREHVIIKLDHKNINVEVDFMKGKFISTENLAMGIWDQLAPHFTKMGVKLHSVKIEETENNAVEYFGT